MKNNTKYLIYSLGLTFIMLVSILISSCNSNSEKQEAQEDVRDANEEVKDAQMELEKAQKEYLIKYNEFKYDSEIKIAENEKYIAELKTNSPNNKKAKAEFAEKISELEKRNQLLKERMYNYKDEGDEKWESFKREFNHDMEGLGNALKDITNKNTK